MTSNFTLIPGRNIKLQPSDQGKTNISDIITHSRLPQLQYELLEHISFWIKTIEEDLNWYLLSRFIKSPKRKLVYLAVSEEKSAKANLILDDGVEILTLIKEFIHGR